MSTLAGLALLAAVLAATIRAARQARRNEKRAKLDKVISWQPAKAPAKAVEFRLAA